MLSIGRCRAANRQGWNAGGVHLRRGMHYVAVPRDKRPSHSGKKRELVEIPFHHRFLFGHPYRDLGSGSRFFTANHLVISALHFDKAVINRTPVKAHRSRPSSSCRTQTRATSAARSYPLRHSPICVLPAPSRVRNASVPLRKVPAVSTTLDAENPIPRAVRTPFTDLRPSSSLMSRDTTVS